MPVSSTSFNPPAPALAAPAVFGRARLIALLGLFAGSRLLLLWISQIALVCIPKGPLYAPSASFIGRFIVWDSIWYLQVIDEGYKFSPASPALSNIAFSPLYPFLVWIVKHMGFYDSAIAGYLVSNAAFLIAAVLLWKLAVEEFGNTEIADRAVVLLVFWPGSFWFSMIYAESLFLALLLAAMLFCRRRQWLAAAAAGFAVPLTRVAGLTLLAFVLFEIIAEWHERRAAGEWRGLLAPPRALASRLLALAAPALGYWSFFVFLRWRFGSWTVQREVLAAGWPDTRLHNPWTHFWEQWLNLQPFFRWITYPFLIIAIVALVLSWVATRRLSYPALVAAFLGLYLSATAYMHFPRYLLVVPPLFLVGGWVAARSRLLEVLLLTGSAALLALLSALLVCGYQIL